MTATARVVSGSEFGEIQERVRAKYGFMMKMTKILNGIVKHNRVPYGDRGVVITLP